MVKERIILDIIYQSTKNVVFIRENKGKHENINLKIYNISSFQAWTPTMRNILAQSTYVPLRMCLNQHDI
jgi:hypothetical protein